MIDFDVHVPLSGVRENRLGNVSPRICFSGTQELGIEGFLRSDLERYLGPSYCLVPIVIDVDTRSSGI